MRYEDLAERYGWPPLPTPRNENSRVPLTERQTCVMLASNVTTLVGQLHTMARMLVQRIDAIEALGGAPFAPVAELEETNRSLCEILLQLTELERRLVRLQIIIVERRGSHD